MGEVNHTDMVWTCDENKLHNVSLQRRYMRAQLREVEEGGDHQ